MRTLTVVKGARPWHLPPLGRSLIASRFGRHHGLAPRRLGAAAAVALFLLGAGASGLSGQEGLGKTTYDKWCSGCHGVDGDGQGVAAEYMLPRPRDFTLALYQIRTTASGELPTDADIRHIIDVGMPTTTMPGWENLLSEAERDALVDYLKTFSRFFGQGDAPQAIDFGRATKVSEAVLAEGREQYQAMECSKCHGEFGRGDGTSASTLEDDGSFPIRAADLTENWKFNGGGSVEDIFRRLRTGLDGTPMPSYQDVVDAGVITEEQLWSVAHYVRSLAPEVAPGIDEVIRAELIQDATLPSTADDPVWDGVGVSYIPLVGQIIVSPRWFDPRVDGLWVQALHDGQELVMRIRWSDPSQSPDPDWAEWKARIIDLMAPKEGDPPEAGPTPDRLVVQFPKEVPTGLARPYFLMGDQRNPVYQWQWRSDQPGAVEAEARGLGTATALPAAEQAVTASATFADGQWTLMLRRPITTESASDLDFTTGEAIPVAFFAWDGDNGESGTRAAISSWYFVFLEEPTSATVFIAPLAAFAITGSLGLLVVGRARKREQEGVVTEDEPPDEE